ncbi:MAG: hypothetical protein ABJE10_05345 [bacterium]
MHSRLTHRMLTCGCITLIGLGACKSDTPLTPNNSLEPIPNPSGPVSVGDLVSLNVNGEDPCDRPVYHGARVVAISSRAIIMSDTLNPKNGFSTADFQRFAARFDTLVYPLDVANFGEPLDIDKNGHIIILFTRAVNELTPPRSNAYVGGFVFSRDLFPTTATARAKACAGSNQGEYFYMLAPDPTGSVNGNVRTTGFVDTATVPVLAHEFQHLINATRRLYVNNSPVFEDKWLDEGLAHVAEELLFYHEAGVSPRANIDFNATRANNTIRLAFTTDMAGNNSRYRTYLGAPSKNSPYALDDSLATRGATWSFLRYAVDRLNATDGFTPGAGQTVTGAGDVVLTSGPSRGEYYVTLANTALQSGASTTFNVSATPAVGSSSIPIADRFAPATVRVAMDNDPSVLHRDESFEAGLRSRERAVLSPMMDAARSWYRSQAAPVSSAVRSQSAYAGTSFADADAATWFRLANNTTAGFANLQSVVGTDLSGLIRDWLVSHAVDDLGALSTQYQDRSWNWHNIYSNIGSSGYPLPGLTITGAATYSGTIVAGGAAYALVLLPANSTTTLSLTAPAGTANPNLQMVVVRTK